jgi:hypothetical protein
VRRRTGHAGSRWRHLPFRRNAWLDLTYSTVSANDATGGTGAYGGQCGLNAGNGGAAEGGGLFVGSGTLQLVGTTISGNSAKGGYGGGSTPSANPPGVGGTGQGASIFVGSGNINIANSTVFANTATGGRGGTAIGQDYSGRGGNAVGGGLYLSRGSVSLASTTIASNLANAGTGFAFGSPQSGSGFGGGIANSGAGLFINNTLIGDNTAGNARIRIHDDVHGTITSSYSLISSTAGTTITDKGGNLFNVDPSLDPNGLQFNGGPTQTVALQSGSPAIDVVPVTHCTDLATPPHPLTTDQRGLPRPGFGETACSIGAYEFQDTIAFSHFSGSLQIDPDTGVFYLSGGFTLGTGGIFDPTTNSVTFSVGSYSITAPAGRFAKYEGGYVYQGTFNGIFFCVFIKFTSTPGQYVLLATATGVVPFTTSPVPVFLFSGNSSGSSQMTATFD